MRSQNLANSNIKDKVFLTGVVPAHEGKPFLSLRSFQGTPPPTTMDDSYEDIENRIFEAIWKAKRVKRPNIAALAREFCVPVSRLRARFQGTPSKKGNSNAKKTLDDAQEAALERWIERLDGLNIHPDPPDINEMANLILFRQFESDMHTPISAHKDAYDSNADNHPSHP